MQIGLSALADALGDRYRIERELGAGGMATVYLAEDLKHHRRVAVKVLRPDLAAALGSDRFLREIEVAASLTHPHILPLHDSGAADGFLYYVMPYIEGESLAARIAREGELPVPEAVRILRDVVDALASAHAHGVVHRDIKPDNVMLAGRHALVMDFGVAKAISEATGRQTITTMGVALGTPAYMAPEQAAADPHIDHRADIYAVGVMAYELLAGQRPFTGNSPQQVLAAQVTQAPKPVTLHRTTVPPALAQLVMRCLEKKPADRPQTAAELLPILDLLSTTSGSTLSLPAPRRAPGFMKVALAVVGLLLLLAAGWWMSRRGGAGDGGGGSEIRSIAVLPLQNQGGDPDNQAFTDGIHDDILTQLSKIAAFQVTSRTSVEEYRTRSKSVREIARELGVNAILEGSVQRSGSQVHVNVQLIDAARDRHLWAESYDRALTAENIFAIQGEIARQVTSALQATLTADESDQLAQGPPTRNIEALDFYHRGNILMSQRGEPAADTAAVRAFSDAVGADSTFGQAWAGLAMARSWLVRRGVERNAAPTLAALRRAQELAPDAPETQLAAGFYEYYVAGDFAAALRHFQAAELRWPSNPAMHEAIGFILRRQGKWEESLAYLQRATLLAPREANRLVVLVQSLAPMRRLDEAEQAMRRALILDPQLERSVNNLVVVLVMKGDTAGARRVLDSTRLSGPAIHNSRALLASYRRDFRTAIAEVHAAGHLPRSTFSTIAFLAKQAYLAGDSALVRHYADSLHRDAMDTKRRIEAGEQLDVFGALAKTHVDIGFARALVGDGEGAVREGKQAVGLLPQSVDALEAPYIALDLSRIYIVIGDYSAAIEQLRYLLSIPCNLSRPILQLDPLYDPLRKDPEFQALLRGNPQ